MAVHALPDGLGAVLPGPKLAGGQELLHREGVEVLEHIGSRDLVEVAVAEGREGALPDELCILAVVELQELRERHREVLEVRILSLDVGKLELGRRAEALIAALGDSTVSIHVVALVLRGKELRELAHLHDLLEKSKLRLLDRGAIGIREAASHGRAIGMRGSAELLALMHGEVGIAAHDSTHLDGALLLLAVLCRDFHLRRECLAADTSRLLIDRVVVESLLLQIHCHRCSCGTATYDADTLVLVHTDPLPSVAFPTQQFQYSTKEVHNLNKFLQYFSEVSENWYLIES